MDSEQFRAAAYSAIDQIIDYYDTIESRRVVSNVSPGYLKPLLPSGPPANPEPWADIQSDIESKILPGITHWQSPNFLAFFPANSSYPGILGELYSATFNSANFNWLCSPAATELETIVLDWLARLLNLPECFLSTSRNGGGGVIQGSASEAICTVIVAARERYLGNLAAAGKSVEQSEGIIDNNRSKLVALFSDQTHSSTQKGCQIAGVKHHSIQVPGSATENYVLTGPLLRKALEELTAKGLHPFFLTVTLGTTATCAADDFASIVPVLKDYPNLWVHVDAAFAGAALILPQYHHVPAPFKHFDSFNMNMHKWLLTNFDCSCLYVRTRKHLLDALSIAPPYLRNPFSEQGLVTDYRDWQIPLGRRFRALKIWFVMRSYGVSGLQRHIWDSIRHGESFAQWVRDRADIFEIVVPPAFALTVFAIKTTRREESNRLTRVVYEAVNADGEIFITSTVIDGIYAIRVVGGGPKIREEVLRRAFEILVSKTEEVLKAEGTPQVSGINGINGVVKIDCVNGVDDIKLGGVDGIATLK
ncbi:unnamed protein product [Tuber melanosporum]|uniref:(Perigord truffle) hypothetical protein n=1 Tax=Tuber melanosporum (strain Mel28) TaxID=656061 RepID=D5GMX8_TUBMM|nr:uncharacterized protein GSTUM_00010987001 [Tuber melanosporum]CAZ85871.1 unnamed protein product [Tuber melanosporum]